MPSTSVELVRPTRLAPTGGTELTIVNRGSNSVFYGQTPTVSSTNKVGTLSENESLTLTKGYVWVVAEETSGKRFQKPVILDLREKEIESSSGSGTTVNEFLSPTNPVVLVGVYGGASFENSEVAGLEIMQEKIGPRPIDIGLYFTGNELKNPLFTGQENFLKRVGLLPMVAFQPEKTLTSLSASRISGADKAELEEGAVELRGFGAPILMRLCSEFNLTAGIPYGAAHETAKGFVEGWENVVSIYRARGANNVLFVWDPNVWAGTEVNPLQADSSGVNWFPGERHIDYVALDGYIKNGETFKTPEELFLPNYEEITAVSERPFIICETGCDQRVAHGQGQWFAEEMAMIRYNMPRCVAINFWLTSKGEEHLALETAVKPEFERRINDYPFVAAPGLATGRFQTTVPVQYAPQTVAGPVKATGSRASVGNIRDLYIPGESRPTRPVSRTEITTFQPGHGWTIQSGAGTISEDTSIFGMGSQSLKIKTTGEAGKERILVGKEGIPAMDLTNYDFRIRVRVENWQAIKRNGLRIRYGQELTENYKERFFGPLEAFENLGSASQYELYGGNKEWQDYTIDAGLLGGGSKGTVNLAAVTALAIYVQDTEAGEAAEVHFQEFALVPKARGPYPYGVISFTFDDGYLDQYTVAKPLLDKYGYPGTAFVITDLIASSGSPSELYLSLEQLKKLEQQSGWEIACHSMYLSDHEAEKGFIGIGPGAVDDNITEQKSWMLANGFRGKDFSAYPKGYYDNAVLNTFKRYFTAARTISGTDGFETFPPGDPMRIRCVPLFSTIATEAAQEKVYEKLVDELYENGGWLIFYCHRVWTKAEEESRKESPSGVQTREPLFKALTEYIANKGSASLSIPVRTFGDVVRASFAVSNASISTAALAPKTGIFQPSLSSWKATPGDPILFDNASGCKLSKEVGFGMYLFGVPGEKCTKLEFNVATLGKVMEKPFFGVYNSAGTRLATATPVFTSTGPQAATLSAEITIPTDGVLIGVIGCENATEAFPVLSGIEAVPTALTAFAGPGAGRIARIFKTTGSKVAPTSLTPESVATSGNIPFLALR